MSKCQNRGLKDRRHGFKILFVKDIEIQLSIALYMY